MARFFIKLLRLEEVTIQSTSSWYFILLTTLQSSSLCLSNSISIDMFARSPRSISSLLVVIFLCGPNKPSSTNLCVWVPSRVPVNPNLYLASVHLVRILVRDLALKLCASSPITMPNVWKYPFCILYIDCHVDMYTRLVLWPLSKPAIISWHSLSTLNPGSFSEYLAKSPYICLTSDVVGTINNILLSLVAKKYLINKYIINDLPEAVGDTNNPLRFLSPCFTAVNW